MNCQNKELPKNQRGTLTKAELFARVGVDAATKVAILSHEKAMEGTASHEKAMGGTIAEPRGNGTIDTHRCTEHYLSPLVLYQYNTITNRYRYSIA